MLNTMRNANQKSFDKKIKRFYKLEDARGKIGKMADKLIKKGFEAEAYLLILSTWNFAGFRYLLKNFDITDFKQVLKKINPVFDKLGNKKFKTVCFDDEELQEDISFIYEKLTRLVKQTGASKIMHFKLPALFVMWDTAIRSKHKITNTRTTAKDYIDFLKLMQEKFSKVKVKNGNLEFARAIDMYNYVETQDLKKKKGENA